MKRVACLLLPLVFVGCALTEKAEVFYPRIFTPPLAAPAPVATGAPQSRLPLLQIGSITAAAHLRSRMVVRMSPVELETYDDREWSERPERYLERSLSRALFGDGIAEQAVSGPPPTLDAELLSFEEVRAGSGRRGRIAIHFTLHDEDHVWLDDTIVVERPARSGASEDVVAALGDALDAATSEVARRVATRLRQPPESEPPH